MPSTQQEKTSSDAGSESDFLIPNPAITKARRRWPWICSTGFLAALCVGLTVRVLTFQCETPTAWRKSDFPAARAIIEYHDVQFYGNGEFDENGTFTVKHKSPIDYVGPPSPEVDQAWADLTGERDFLISEKEARELWGDEFRVHWHHRKKGYSVGLDVFHTLHCLDNIRRLFYPEYYALDPENHEAHVRHRGHCIDQIRQYIMCAGDMTAYGTRWFENPGRNYADSDVVHTCRNFDKLRGWTRNRYHAGGGLHLPDVTVWEHWREEKVEYQPGS
ncbi:hypothetical protein QBC34DRAFT_475069 [Podospora aff. communis PSN243]|uniref:Tat pathway signal sequence n=1 Tax=Podospora aff. communis PSN243 TaxID=3040156 RepID=A0AAV9G8E2_9PEZI|nr:hypothetical protein QBC34DRAFT_475069 [Podospora aff. communis PSN243]